MRAMSGQDFLLALEKAGVLQKADLTRRVVIDACVDEPVLVYIENIGDARLLDVVCDESLGARIVIRTSDAAQQKPDPKPQPLGTIQKGLF